MFWSQKNNLLLGTEGVQGSKLMLPAHPTLAAQSKWPTAQPLQMSLLCNTVSGSSASAVLRRKCWSSHMLARGPILLSCMPQINGYGSHRDKLGKERREQIYRKKEKQKK